MILYKYITFDRLESLLDDQKIRFTQFFDQNDLYEFSFALLPIEREREQAIQDDYSAERAEMKVSFENKYFQFGMLCLTKNFNNILMWAHYADNHKGAVVGFDISHSFFNSKEKFYTFTCGELEEDIDLMGVGSIRPIDYLTTRRQISYGDYYGLEELFFAKSIHWKYEEEYRILKNIYKKEPSKILSSGEKIYLFDIPKECIVEIILGLRCNYASVNSIFNKISNNYASNVKLSKAKLSHLTFDIVTEPLNLT
jgi:hypothetical protein